MLAIIQSLLQSAKTYLGGLSKGALALAGVGVCSLILAIVIVTNNHRAAPMIINPVSKTEKSVQSPQTGNTSDAHSGSASQTNTSATGQTAGPSAKPGTPSSANTTANGSAKTANGTQSNSSTVSNGSSKSNPKSNPASPTPPSTPKADYNLNDNWYIATVGVAGLFNSCWPTPLTQDNEATCGDPASPYTNVLFEGVGISKDPSTATTLAGNNAQQKADAQHVDVRRGGGGDPILLTEDLCSQYGLSCARW